MAQYVRLQLGKGKYRGRQLLSERVVEEMHSPQMIIPRESFYTALFPDAHFLSYGLGWITHDYHGYKVVEHGGQTDGMHGTLAMIPELGLGVVVLTNSVLFGYPSAIGYRVFDTFLGRPPRDWSAEIRAGLRPMNEGGGPRAPPRATGTTPTIPAERLVGRYRHQLYGDAEVVLRDGRLTLTLLGQTAALEHWQYDTYRPLWQNLLVRAILSRATFERDGRGEVRAVRFDAVGDFERVREER
jgi:CubicO group peptidase (beta-lactamase class C family)